MSTMATVQLKIKSFVVVLDTTQRTRPSSFLPYAASLRCDPFSLREKLLSHHDKYLRIHRVTLP